MSEWQVIWMVFWAGISGFSLGRLYEIRKQRRQRAIKVGSDAG